MYSHHHLLGIDGLVPAEIEAVLDRADAYANLNAERQPISPTLSGRTVINLFFEPSTRTQASFELAAKRLGATVMNMAMKNSSVTKGETLLDTAVTLNAMLPDMLVIRHPHSGAAALLSAKVNCAVLNAGDGWHEHPTQALLDALTIRRAFRKRRNDDRLSGLTIAICGDILHSRVARSNIFLHRAYGNTIRVAGPSPLIPAGLDALGVEVCRSLEEAVAGADVVMMLRLQRERMSGAFIPSTREFFNRFGLDAEELEGAKPDALVMHPGPMNRGVEIDSTLADDTQRSVIADQVEMGVAVRMAMLEILSENLPYTAPASTRVPGTGPRRRHIPAAAAKQAMALAPRTLLRNARLIDPEAETETRGGVLIEGTRIADVGAHLANGAEVSDAEVVDCAGHCVAPGLIDMRVHVGEPGERHNESFGTAGHAAVAGGVTTIVTRPDTVPVVDDSSLLDFIAKRVAEEREGHAMPRVYTMAGLTKDLGGELMTEYAFLTEHEGCVGLSNGDRSVANAQVLRRCLAYAADLGVLVSHQSQEPDLTGGGCATAGAFATRLGLPGPGQLAESLMLERDLRLAVTAGGPYHAEQVSTGSSVAALRRAKGGGADITAAASLPHIVFSENDIHDYRTFYKVFPPLRAEADRQALIEGLKDGTIDCIVSSHRARNEDSKRQPYEAAAAGALGVETLLSGALKLVESGALTLPQLIRKMTLNPAQRLAVTRPDPFAALGRLSAGAAADLIVFDDGASWQLDRRWLQSKSKNSPFDKASMRGLVTRTVVAGATVHLAEPEPVTPIGAATEVLA